MLGHFPLGIANFLFQHFYLVAHFLNLLLLRSQPVVDLLLLVVLALVLNLNGLMRHCFLVGVG